MPERSERRYQMGVIGLMGMTFLIVSGGAYGLEDAIGPGGPAPALIGLLVLPWIWSLPAALMTAELSGAMPDNGGYVTWVERAFGRFWGFQTGWWGWMSSFADNALYPVLFAEYLKYFRPTMSPNCYLAVCLGVITLFTGLNLIGVRPVVFSSITFSVAILTPFVFLVLLGLPHMHPATWSVRHFTGNRWAAWSTILTTLLWNLTGWNSAGNCAEEVSTPHRTFPRALVTTLIVVTLAYLLPVAVGVSVSRDWTQWKTGYFTQIAKMVGGPWLGGALMIGALCSAMGMLNALLLATSRLPCALAQRHTLPASLGRLSRKEKIPRTALLVNSIGCGLLVVWKVGRNSESDPFSDLLKIDMCLFTLSLALAFAALIWLRLREPEMPRRYKIPLGVNGLVVFCLPAFALCGLNVALCPRSAQILAAGLTVVGWAAYLFCKPSLLTTEKK